MLIDFSECMVHIQNNGEEEFLWCKVCIFLYNYSFELCQLFYSTSVTFVSIKVFFNLIPLKNLCMDIKADNTFPKKILGTRPTTGNIFWASKLVLALLFSALIPSIPANVFNGLNQGFSTFCCSRTPKSILSLFAYPQIKFDPLCVHPKTLLFSCCGLILIWFKIPCTPC